MENKKYNVILEKVGNQPLMTTKILCGALSLGLAKAKGIVDNAPTTIAFDTDRATALNLKGQLEEIGNTVSVPGLEIEPEPLYDNNALSVDEAFDAIFGVKSTPKSTEKSESHVITPRAEKKNIAAVNGAFDALFGNQEKGTEK